MSLHTTDYGTKPQSNSTGYTEVEEKIMKRVKHNFLLLCLIQLMQGSAAEPTTNNTKMSNVYTESSANAAPSSSSSKKQKNAVSDIKENVR